MVIPDGHDALSGDCWKVITGMASAIVILSGGIAYCARGWLDSVLARVQDRNETIAQLRAARTTASSKGGSP